MREGVTGYVPGSVVWVPWSVARPRDEAVETEPSWISRLFKREKPSLYHRCLALHMMNVNKREKFAS